MRGPWALLLPLAACGGGSTAPRPVSNATPIGAAPSPVRCELEAGHETGYHVSPPQVYEAATRFFLRYTTPGGPHDLGEELNAERDTLVFDTTSDRRNARDTQAPEFITMIS